MHGISFYNCTFVPIDWENPTKNNKWIESRQEALKAGLKFNQREDAPEIGDDTYKTSAQYLFVIGGGDRWVTAADCEGEIAHDTIKIRYRPEFHRGQVAEAAPSLICMELNKKLYPEYRNMKIVFEAIMPDNP